MLKNRNILDMVSELVSFEGVKLAKLRQQKNIGLQNTDGLFTPCAISLSPWLLTEEKFELAKNTAAAIGKLFLQASLDSDFLNMALSDFIDESSLLFKLNKIHQTRKVNNDPILATNFNLSRQDFLLDSDEQWRLVESNSIAAGMGPFAQKTVEIQQQIPVNACHHYASNQAIALQSKAIFQAALKNNKAPNPLIIFVVEEREDNIHDQAMLCKGLKIQGARVVYKTLSQLKGELQSSANRLTLNIKNSSIEENESVDFIYFRTGYNLRDYEDGCGGFDSLLRFRAWMEEHQVTVCPSINYQMATSKWIQMKLSAFSQEALLGRFLLNTAEAKLAAAALETRFVIPKDLNQIKLMLKSGNWVLKTQNEGGGNVLDQYSELSILSKGIASYILMEKIPAGHRQDRVRVMTKRNSTIYHSVTSELGIFTSGDESEYAGYLLRSKPAGQLESGVHRAGGFLDCVALL